MNQKITKRLWTLFIMVVVGFSLVWVMPNAGKFQMSRLLSDLPEILVERTGKKLPISADEREQLAPDTTFARKRYSDKSASPDSFIDVSVVFSGKDINNSIHRPEVCLKAQGWNFESEKYINLDLDGKIIPFKEIICARPRVKNDKLPHLNLKGEVIVDRRIQYYTFVGSEAIVAGHYERTWEDIKTRVLQGTDQQWAYLTISMDVTDNPSYDFGESYYNKLDLEQTQEAIKQFKLKALPVLLKG